VNDATSSLLLQLLSASTLRSQVIANNLANQNNPGFKRQIVDFEDRLLEALRDGPSAARAIRPSVTTDTVTPDGPNGNNVNMELEINAMRENRIAYETYAAILSGRLEMIRASIEESR
jgi:flagellar basal-body rod protein FlgB